jgi:L-asparaginase / beta-aspartyl-peptidase
MAMMLILCSCPSPDKNASGFRSCTLYCLNNVSEEFAAMSSTKRLIVSCDDAAWPDFLGFPSAVVALQKGVILDALEGRICAVEDAGLDSVGPTGTPDEHGKHTQDTGIMTGWNRLSASLGALDGYKNPFRVVRRMLELQQLGQFPHNFLVGDGAALFAQQQGGEPVRASNKIESFSNKAHDTVGCIAFDGQRWAVGTSTSGWGGKKAGRLGDAPVVGGGFYANAHGAAFCTWTGEIAARLSLASRAMIPLEMGMSLDKAVKFAFSAFDKIADGHKGGVILHVATAGECAVVGVGFENDIIPATYSFWHEGMKSPERRPVPAWSPSLPVPVF